MPHARRNPEAAAPVAQPALPATDEHPPPMVSATSADLPSTMPSKKIVMDRRLYSRNGSRALDYKKIEFTVPTSLSDLINSAREDLNKKHPLTCYEFTRMLLLISRDDITGGLLYDPYYVRERDGSWETLTKLLLALPVDPRDRPVHMFSRIEFQSAGKRTPAKAVSNSLQSRLQYPSAATRSLGTSQRLPDPAIETLGPLSREEARIKAPAETRPAIKPRVDIALPMSRRPVDFVTELYSNGDCVKKKTEHVIFPIPLTTLIKDAGADVKTINDKANCTYTIVSIEVEIPESADGATKRVNVEFLDNFTPWEQIVQKILAVPRKRSEPLEVRCRVYFRMDRVPFWLELERRWTCRDEGCNRYSRTCWVDDDVHYVLNVDDQFAWSDAIEEGRADIQKPPSSLAKVLLQKRSGRLTDLPTTAKRPLEHGDGNAGRPAKKLSKKPAPPPPRKSLPHGHEGDIRHFFSWLKSEDPARAALLDSCCETFIGQLYTLEGIEDYSYNNPENELDIPRGLFLRLSDEVIAYQNAQEKERSLLR